MGSDNDTQRVFTKRLTNPAICIHLATTREKLYLHQQILHEKSRYFRSLRSSGLRESLENTVILELTVGASKAFHAVAEYLYTDKYHPCGETRAERSTEAAYVFVLADRFLMPALKEAALERLCVGFGEPTSVAPTERVRTSTEKQFAVALRKATREILPESELESRTFKRVSFAPSSMTARSDATYEDPMLTAEYIQLMKRILYEDALDLDDTADVEDDEETPEDNEEASGPAVLGEQAELLLYGNLNSRSTRTEEDSSSGDKLDTINRDPRRDAQLAFTQFLSRQLPTLRHSQGFKDLLATGYLDGSFMIDLLCPNLW